MQKIIKSFILLSAVATLAMTAATVNAVPAMKVDNVIWANGELYGTVLTGASFKKGPAKSMDLLFMFDEENGLAGQGPISDAAPGDAHYNGGRWAVVLMEVTEAGADALDMYNADMEMEPDGVIDEEITSAHKVNMYVELGYITLTYTDNYFSCPLIK